MNKRKGQKPQNKSNSSVIDGKDLERNVKMEIAKEFNFKENKNNDRQK